MNYQMKPADVQAWLDIVRAKGLATTDLGAGELIGKSPDTVIRMKQKGADRAIGLACAAVLNGIEPFTVQAGKVKPVAVLPKVHAALTKGIVKAADKKQAAAKAPAKKSVGQPVEVAAPAKRVVGKPVRVAKAPAKKAAPKKAPAKKKAAKSKK